jgi:ankyrin repeat protein
MLYDMSSILLRTGADIDEGYNHNHNGWKAIHHACYSGDEKLVRILLESYRRSNHNVPIDCMIQSEGWYNQTTAFHVIQRILLPL